MNLAVGTVREYNGRGDACGRIVYVVLKALPDGMEVLILNVENPISMIKVGGQYRYSLVQPLFTESTVVAWVPT